MRTRTLVSALLVGGSLALAGVACGGGNPSSDTVATRPANSGVDTNTTPTTTTTETGGIDTLAGAGTDPVTGAAQGEETALLERLSVARHEGYDRVVFQFKNTLPGYRIEYVEPPFKEDGSGNPVHVGGKAYVVVRMEPASGFDLTKPEGELVYKGPRRIEGSDAGTSTVREVVRSGDFEAVLAWIIGLDDRVDFRVTTLDAPSRLVIDFRNH